MPDEWLFESDRDGVRMRHAATRRLYGYWNRLRRERPAPDRREIEPAEIGGILSDTFILEVGANDDYPYRLAGTNVCSAFGAELKGSDWLARWNARDREALATLMRKVVSDAAGAIIQFDARNIRGQKLPMETLLLPLALENTGNTRILGATLALDKPYWLGALPVRDVRLSDIGLIWPKRARAEQTGFTQSASELPLRRLGHLALYDGGRAD